MVGFQMLMPLLASFFATFVGRFYINLSPKELHAMELPSISSIQQQHDAVWNFNDLEPLGFSAKGFNQKDSDDICLPAWKDAPKPICTDPHKEINANALATLPLFMPSALLRQPPSAEKVLLNGVCLHGEREKNNFTNDESKTLKPLSDILLNYEKMSNLSVALTDLLEDASAIFGEGLDPFTQLKRKINTVSTEIREVQSAFEETAYNNNNDCQSLLDSLVYVATLVNGTYFQGIMSEINAAGRTYIQPLRKIVSSRNCEEAKVHAACSLLRSVPVQLACLLCGKYFFSRRYGASVFRQRQESQVTAADQTAVNDFSPW